MTDLDRLLETLDPARTLDVASARTDHALNTFPVSSGVVETWDGFQALLTRFCLHAQKAILNLSSGYEGDPDFAWAECRQVLNKQYGRSGYKAAFEMARTGNQGGLSRILRVVAEGLADMYGGQEVAARAQHFLNRLTSEERIAVAREYVRKYGHLLPSELTEGSAVRIVDNFADVLKEHPRLMRRLRRVGR